MSLVSFFQIVMTLFRLERRDGPNPSGDKFCQAECQRSRSVSRSDLQSRYAEETDSRITEIGQMRMKGIEFPG